LSAEETAWRLLDQAQVDGQGIFLHQIVVRPTPPAQDAPIRLADAPLVGQTASFTRERVAELMASHQSALAIPAWTGAPQVRVSRRTRTLAEAELKTLLTERLQHEVVKDKGEIELRLGRPWTPVTVPDEPFVLKVSDLPATGVSPNFILRFELATAHETVGQWQLVAGARLWRDVPVSRALLRRGQMLRDAEVSTERRDVLGLREPLEVSALADPSLELVENVPAGFPVLRRSVRVRPLVQRGEVVDATMRDGLLVISLKAECLEDGLPGQTIRLRNPKTKREFYGKIQPDQTVLISL
jgi:flagella basal body P-ring formation protein FlgA